MKISAKGIAIIKHFESLHDGDLSKIGLQPKLCPAGIATVGWGHALSKIDGSPVMSITEAIKLFPQYANMDITTAERLLAEDSVRFENGVNSLGLKLNQNQFDALVSFSFNAGLGSLRQSSLLKRVRGTIESPSIKDCFLMWNKGTVNGVKQVLKGLTLRRKAEAELYLS